MTTKVIAEIGPNHNGDIKLAKELILSLKDSGVDYIKFQLAIPDEVYSDDSFFANYQRKNSKQKSIIEMSKQIQLTYQFFEILSTKW